MIRWLFKYGTVIFLFNTILLSIASTIALGDMIFLGLMGVFSVILLINPYQIKEILFHKAFVLFLIINLINIIYFFLFHSMADIAAGKYLLARGVQFSIISCSIFYHYEYYRSRFLIHIVYGIFLLILLSFVFDPNIFSGRYSGLIWNPNMLASLTSIAFAVLLLSQKQRTKFDSFLLVFLLIISLATGSRGILVAISLAYLFKYGFSIRNIIYAFFALVSYFVLVNIQLDTSINRFVSQDLFNDRLLQYHYAYETLLQKPLFGFGLDKYAYINPEVVPYYLRSRLISAHNGYLAIFTQYGIVFGSIILVIVFKKSIQVINWFKQSFDIERTYLFIIIYALFASVYETLLTGINEFHTILFWFSLAFLSYSNYRTKYES